MRGNSFWDAINESNSNKHADKILNYTRRQHHISKQIKTTKKAKKVEEAEEDDSESAERHLLKGSLQAQLKAAMAAHSEVNMKIDFNKKGIINYGMTCIIMNYANEVLYVDKYNELRAKPMSQVHPTDRIKFKMIDLLSPSNPRAIHFGQNCWLQCLDLSDNADNSFQGGSVLTTKLFGPPELESVNFADSYSKLGADERAAGEGDIKGKADSKALALLNDKDEQKKKSATSSVGKDSHRGLGSDDETDDRTRHSQSSWEEEGDGESLASMSRRSSIDINDASSASNAKRNDKKGKKDLDEEDNPKKLDENAKSASVCGYVALNRIVEMRKDQGHFMPDSVMSDEKALRYNSKQALHLGKWTIQPARREDIKLNFFDDDDEDGHDGGNAGHHHHHHGHSNFVQSITPIVIQQDHYCLSTAPSVEYRHWPPNSSSIVRTSDHINPDQAEEYERRYAKALINNINTDHPTQANKDIVSNQKHFENKKKLYFMASKSLDTSPQPVKSRSGIRGHGKAATSGHMLEDEQYGCIRKVVHRSAPYDFVVDRRCVWQICLFEQFAESYVAMSSKERQIQKVMETATVALKLSKLNREGARKHMNSCHIKIVHHSISGHGLDHSMSSSLASLNTLEHPLKDDLPPLLGGESFSRSLREISFKTAQFTEDAYLKDRREKETHIQEYFADKIKGVFTKEETRARSLSPSNSVSKRSLASLQPDDVYGGNSKGDKQVSFFATEEDEDEDSAEEAQEHSPVKPKRTERPIDRALLLNTPQTVTKYRDLSAGEQLLSMHKTFSHYNKAASVSTMIVCDVAFQFNFILEVIQAYLLVLIPYTNGKLMSAHI
ncbi:hypothetical protein EON64_00600 [archaeon]|nr:MAG: hypothetical protein EON64_00600 [archaeon]